MGAVSALTDRLLAAFRRYSSQLDGPYGTNDAETERFHERAALAAALDELATAAEEAGPSAWNFPEFRSADLRTIARHLREDPDNG